MADTDPLDEILTRLGLQPAEPVDIPGYDPDEPGHPAYHHQQRAAHALTRWTTATPPRYQTALPSDPQVLAWAAAVVRTPETAGSLLITGTTGTGKTHEAYGALRLIAAAGPRSFQLRAVAVADLYGALRPGGPAGAAENQLKAWCKVPLLLLDDLGSAKASEWTEEVTYRLINHRYNHCLPTLFTSNLPAASREGRDLTAALGERIVSRLAEMTTVIAMAGDDRRKRKAA